MNALKHLSDAGQTSERLARSTAQETVEWSSSEFGDGLVLSTSFGIQSAVMLHLTTSVKPDIPVIWIDTGYLPEQTYRFANELTNRLQLNLHVYQSPISPARMESQYGRLWESDNVDDLNRYDQLRKVEPLNRALDELGATAWLSGLRRQQTEFRSNLAPLSFNGSHYKVLPILNWTSKDVYQYLTAHDLPFHPLFDEGYVSVGDWHSSRPISADDDHQRETRFGGLKQECGIHLPELAGGSLTAIAA